MTIIVAPLPPAKPPPGSGLAWNLIGFALAVVTPFILGVAGAISPEAVLLSLPQLAAWLIWAPILLVAVSWSAWRRRWPRVKQGAGLLILLLACLWIGRVGAVCGWMGQLACNYPTYRREIMRDPDRRQAAPVGLGSLPDLQRHLPRL